MNQGNNSEITENVLGLNKIFKWTAPDTNFESISFYYTRQERADKKYTAAMIFCPVLWANSGRCCIDSTS